MDTIEALRAVQNRQKIDQQTIEQLHSMGLIEIADATNFQSAGREYIPTILTAKGLRILERGERPLPPINEPVGKDVQAVIDGLNRLLQELDTLPQTSHDAKLVDAKFDRWHNRAHTMLSESGLPEDANKLSGTPHQAVAGDLWGNVMRKIEAKKGFLIGVRDDLQEHPGFYEAKLAAANFGRTTGERLSKTPQHPGDGPLILISHSSKDKTLAESIIDLLRSAMLLSADKITCSSVEGHRLPLGVKTGSGS